LARRAACQPAVIMMVPGRESNFKLNDSDPNVLKPRRP
jgi:hypothetical protein